MPSYDYFCETNGLTIEATHSIKFELTTWGELCYTTQTPLGDTDPLAPVRKVLSPPNISIPIANTRLKERGFTKLVKRDAGVYENVTATGGESRYVKAGDQSSLPHLHKKVSD